MKIGKEQKDLERVTAELAALVQDAHAFMKDFKREKREAQILIEELRNVIRDTSADLIETTVDEKLTEMDKRLEGSIKESVKRIQGEFNRISELIMNKSAENASSRLTLEEAALGVLLGKTVEKHDYRASYRTDIVEKPK